ncbi:hypothetical protein B296_00003287 [Ensete ventricosum]|uniref:Uncharacterized protein n=1 Tax=Ensete ventricosum TaxID=4639 RepID=A0A427BAT8_ENSVE|nr:hypothetical protein B296_00003287 [Ensete ventricosum]
MAIPLATVTPIIGLRRLQSPRSNCDAAAAARRLSGAREAVLFGLKFACCRATAGWDRRPKPARALMVEEGRTTATVRIVTVVGDGSVSPLKNTPWEQVIRHTVRTQEGTLVWRRRKYRVRRASVPGTFYFSVLDNGVVSKEFWTIIDVCDNLSWGLFHYSGAAQVAGLSYTGAVLVSPDGNFKPELGGQRLVSALEKCSIMDWELYRVDNCSCNNPPLGIPEGSRLHSKIELRNQRWVSQQLG